MSQAEGEAAPFIAELITHLGEAWKSMPDQLACRFFEALASMAASAPDPIERAGWVAQVALTLISTWLSGLTPGEQRC